MFTFKKLSTCPLHSKCANRVQYICLIILIIAFNVFFFLLFNVVFAYETLKRRHGLWRQTSIRALMSSLLHIAPLDAILKPKNLEHRKELWVRKAVACGYSAKELPKTSVCTQGISAQFSARVQGRELVLGHGHRARILAWVLGKKVCSH